MALPRIAPPTQRLAGQSRVGAPLDLVVPAEHNGRLDLVAGLRKDRGVLRCGHFLWLVIDPFGVLDVEVIS